MRQTINTSIVDASVWHRCVSQVCASQFRARQQDMIAIVKAIPASFDEVRATVRAAWLKKFEKDKG